MDKYNYVNEIFAVGRAHIKHSITRIIIRLIVDLIFLVVPVVPLTGGYLVQKTLRGCAANMGSKISLLVYK